MIKSFLFNFSFLFISTTTIFTTLMYVFSGEFPKDFLGWVIMFGIISVFHAIGEIKTNKKIEDNEQLTRDNYWKLKNELKRKVNRRK